MGKFGGQSVGDSGLPYAWLLQEIRQNGGSAWESNPPIRRSREDSSVLKLIEGEHPQVYVVVQSCPFSSINLYLGACSCQRLSLA